MRKKSTGKGLMMIGSLRTAGITVYQRNGQMVTRSSHSNERRSNTPLQFAQRQKMRHSVELWKMLKFCEKLYFTEGLTAYLNFISLANRLPAVYVGKTLMDQASFLMPGIPVSDGTLPTVKQQLGEVDGTSALITDFRASEWLHNEKWWLYTAEQNIEGRQPLVQFKMREVPMCELAVVDGCFALVGKEFDNEMKGWALVRVMNDRCSPQGIVTRCTLYQQYTTEEALQKAAKSYKGITGIFFLSPR